MKSYIGASMPLSVFMKAFNEKGKLSRADRIVLVEQALILLEMNYVHLPMKRAIHATDPVLRLKRLRFQISETRGDALPSEIQFHTRVQNILTSARDIHKNYTLPAPFNTMTAYLPFAVEQYYARNDRVGKRSVTDQDDGLSGNITADKKPRFLVSHVAQGFGHPSFKKGVEVLFWNGVPIERAIELNGDRLSGSNLEARFAHGLDSLTIRPMNRSLPPEEMWVVVTYLTKEGHQKDIKIEWRVFVSKRRGRKAGRKTDRATAARAMISMNTHKDAINRVRKLMFATGTGRAQKAITAETCLGRLTTQIVKTSMADAFKPLIVRTSLGGLGYVRIFTFRVDSEDQVDEFVKEFGRLVESLPQQGLIIDVRGNGGGHIGAAERLLQLLTNRKINPTLFEIINNPLNLEICRRLGWLNWADSIAQSVLTGAMHSRAFPITSEEACNDTGQI